MDKRKDALGCSLAAAAALLLILWLLNPTKERHLAVLGPVGHKRMPTHEEMTKGITNQVIQPEPSDYHNFVVFSTLTLEDGTLQSIGFLYVVLDRR